MGLGIDLAERGLLPDSVVRLGIRRLLRQRIAELTHATPMAQRAAYDQLVRRLRETPIAIETAAANEQHYEVPTPFFQRVLGHRMKYSSCIYPRPGMSLDEAEDAMLALTCRRAGLRDGMDILELGCGWGSLTLWMAEHYPNARITGVSNSRTQRMHIMEQARRRGLGNVEIWTRDVNILELPRERFDRVVSVEMFEHARNYEQLLGRVASWLRPNGRLFVHIFTHGTMPYPFEVEGDDNWMGRYFFTGGIMPSDDLFYRFQDDLVIERHWRVSGRHYQQTSEHWLQNMDARREEIMPVLAKSYGREQATRWWNRWRIFFMSCAELWGYRGGAEWMVSHYRFRKRG